MARFTVRIELHNANWNHYEAMYQHLANVNITDVIVSDEGRRYKLPPAEYNYEGNATAAQVLETAKQCAARVVSSYSVLVTESVRRSWHNLSPV